MLRKKMLLCFLPLLLSLFIGFPAVAAAEDSMAVMVNNNALKLNTPSVKINGVLMVPAKELMESLGGSFTYDVNTMKGTARAGEHELVFKLDDTAVCFDGKFVSAPVPMKILSYRFMLPAVFTASKLGAATAVSTYRNTLMIFQPEGGRLVYKVMPGDTLWLLSQCFGTSIASLRQLNGITGDMLYIGQKLIIRNFAPVSVSIPAYTTGGATLRTGAGFDKSIAGYLGASTAITVTGKVGDWYKVATPKGGGYLYYTVVGMSQELSFSPVQSAYFASEIPVDTSMDTLSYKSHTVVKGDSIWALSQKYGIPDYELAYANNLTPTSVLYPGNILKIPVHSIAVKKTPGPQYGEILDWFKQAQYVFPIGKTGKIIDTATGKSFNVKRTMGASHSDTETLTIEDTRIMKEIFGGNWSWVRKSFLLEVDGRRFAVSVSGMPHAGVDGLPYLQIVDNRSDNYGKGPNYDSISGNGMDGHFDMYFLNGLRHADNRIDPSHQYGVLASGGLH